VASSLPVFGLCESGRFGKLKPLSHFSFWTKQECWGTGWAHHVRTPSEKLFKKHLHCKKTSSLAPPLEHRTAQRKTTVDGHSPLHSKKDQGPQGHADSFSPRCSPIGLILALLKESQPCTGHQHPAFCGFKGWPRSIAVFR